MTITVGVAQFAATDDKAANRETIARLVGDAVDQGAQLILCPENAMFTDWASDESPDTHEELDGEFGTFLDGLAARHEVTVIAGMTERVAGAARGFNTVIASGPQGRIGHYRKVHLYDAFRYRESEHVIAGDFEPLVVEVGGLRLGVMTCYDLRFPEIARALVDAGADGFLVPAAWVVGPRKEDHWEVLLRARAIENTAYAVAAGQCGKACAGLSMVVDPMGVVIANAGESEGAVVGRLDPQRISQVRAMNPCLQNRRFAVTPARSS